MLPFKHILFPVDLSEKCSDFSPYVAAVARRFGAEVTLLHVIDWNPLPYYGADPALGMAIAMTDGFRERRQEQLDQFLTDVFTGVPVKRTTQLGEAGATIAAYAAANPIDLIMMPTHGYGRFRSLLLGSVTAKVLHDAACPVWTSAHTLQILSLGMPDFRQILCAVEPAAESVALVRAAAQTAHELGGEMRLVHAIPVIEAATDISLRALSAPDALFAYARDEIRRIQAEAGTNAEVIVEPGDVSMVVHRAAVKFKAGLVITGRGCLQETLGRLRTHAYSIIRDAPCPVLSLYTGPAAERVHDEEFTGSSVLSHA